MFPEFNTLPNIHVSFHLSQHAVSYGNLINSSVGIKEMVHRTFKNFAPHTNKKEIDLDLIRRYNTMEGLRSFFDNNTYKEIGVFNNWFITNNSNNTSEGEVFCYNFININQKISNSKLIISKHFIKLLFRCDVTLSIYSKC